jgi:hypothetical protein
MVVRMKATAPAATAVPIEDDAPSEHIYIGGDDFVDPATAGRTVRRATLLNNPIRHVGAELTFYEEGVLKVTEQRKGKPGEPFFLDLRFLDPVPTIERVIAKRWLLAALGGAVAAALAVFLLRFEVIHVAALAVLVVAALATAGVLYVGVYRSYEKTEFHTIHGRAVVLRFLANLGSIKKFHAIVPVLSGAIEESTERIGADTAAYLRAEMREHYRLRGAGVLSNETCAAGTGRILAQFDVQL